MPKRDILPNRITRGDARALKRWEVRITRRLLPKQARAFHRKVHLQIADLVILGTPVGNPRLWQSPPPPGYTGGRARGGWQSSIGAPITTETGDIDPDGVETARKGARALRQLKEFSQSFISNPVPYIGLLNNRPSHSTQTPGMFVEDAIDAVKAQFR